MVIMFVVNLAVLPLVSDKETALLQKRLCSES